MTRRSKYKAVRDVSSEELVFPVDSGNKVVLEVCKDLNPKATQRSLLSISTRDDLVTLRSYELVKV